MSNASFKVLVALVLGLALGAASFGLWASTVESPTTTQPIAAPTSTSETPITTTSVAPTTTTTSTPAPTTTTIPPKEMLVIHGVGDVTPDPNYIPALVANGYEYAWSGLDGIFRRDGLTVVNLECVPSDLGAPLDKTFVFRCPTEALPSIRDAGIEVANLGNNHSGDYGRDALVDGRAQLIAAGIAPVGAGADYEEAGAPAIFEIGGWTVAVVGFGGVAPSPSWYAAENRPGMRSGDDTAGMVEAVAAAAEVADIVIVTIHWGFELDTTPRADDVDRARAMIEAGADIIFGHHQHRLGPFGFEEEAAVFWGLGNFVWPHNSTASATTGIGRVVVHPDGSMEMCLIPTFIVSHGHPVITGDPECGPGLGPEVPPLSDSDAFAI